MQGRALSRQRLKGCSSSRQCTQRPVSAWTHTRARAAPKGAKGARSRLVVRAGPVEIDEEDLMQIPDRLKWYDVKYAADDMPDWNPARFVSSTQMGPGVRHVVLEVEISRERVPLRNAYKCAGQRAIVRINSGVEEQAPVCSAPHSVSLNKDSLFKVRGDLFAHEIKLPKEPISVMAPIELLVSKEDSPELYKLQEDDSVEVGPFQGAGLALKDSPIMAIYRYPTLVLFVSGQGIAAAKALLGCSPEVPNMHLKFRKNVCMFYKVPNDASICFREELSTWEEQHHCRVVTTTGSFQDAFDDDDKLAYDPEYTGAIVLTGGDEEAEKAALAVCREAEISQVLTDSLQSAPPVYLDSTPKSFQRWAKKKDPVVSE